MAVWTQYVKFTEELIVKAVCWSEPAAHSRNVHPSAVRTPVMQMDGGPRQHRCNSDGPRAEAPREPLASIHPTCRRALTGASIPSCSGGCGRRHCCQHATIVIGQAIAYRLQDKEGRANGIKLDGGGLDGRELRQEVVSCTW